MKLTISAVWLVANYIFLQVLADSSTVRSKLLATNDIDHANGGSNAHHESRLSPIILMPGDGGSRLQAKLNRTDVVHHYCERRSNDWFDLWVNLSLLVPFALDCWVEK